MPARWSSSAHPLLWLGALALGMIALVLAATLLWLGPLPPRSVMMITGPPGSDYALLAARYQSILKRSGVELRLRPSAGGVEDLQRLMDPKSGVMVGFAQGGLTSEGRAPELRSLGTLFYQPFWFFSRLPPGPSLAALRGKRISIGPEGSGTRAMALQLLRLNGIDPGMLVLDSGSPAVAGEALLHGDIDAAAFVASWDTPAVRRLLASSDVNLVSFPRADAYVALYPYFHKLTLPSGVGNLATNRPPADVQLIAPKASLIVRRELHPAIQYLLLQAATEVHSGEQIFQRAGQFPAAERDDLPLSDEAQNFYRGRSPFLQKYLPFWLAVLVSRTLVLLIPIAGVLYPMLRLAPMLYLWNVRRRIFELYGELKLIEAELDSAGHAATPELLTRLRRLQERAERVRLPINFAPILYNLRTHVALVLSRATGPRQEVIAVPRAQAAAPGHASGDRSRDVPTVDRY